MTQGINPNPFASAELLVKEVNVLVSLPEICLRLREILAAPDHSRKEVADVLKYDPAMSSRVLRIVNCAYFGLPSRVQNISQALGILGEQELKNLVFVSAIVKRLTSSAQGMDIQRFWKSSVLAAVCARNLGKQAHNTAQEELFLTGLMLNIGKLVLYTKEPVLYATMAQLKDITRTDFGMEQDLLGYDHCEVGALLARQWNFSEQLSQSIAHHHDNPGTTTGAHQVVMHFAAWFSDQLYNTDSCDPASLEPYPFQTILLDKLGMLFETGYGLLEQSVVEYLQIYEAFCGDSPDVH